MTNNRLTLGVALARLRQIKSEKNLEQPDDSDSKYIKHLYELLQSLRDNRNKSEEILRAIFSHRCQDSETSPPRKEEFFTLYLLLYDPGQSEAQNQKLLKHMNDCFYCFDSSSNVMRDYCTNV